MLGFVVVLASRASAVRCVTGAGGKVPQRPAHLDAAQARHRDIQYGRPAPALPHSYPSSRRPRRTICCSFCPSWSVSLRTRTGSATAPPPVEWMSPHTQPSRPPTRRAYAAQHWHTSRDGQVSQVGHVGARPARHRDACRQRQDDQVAHRQGVEREAGVASEAAVPPSPQVVPSSSTTCPCHRPTWAWSPRPAPCGRSPSSTAPRRSPAVRA